jgi:protease IV
MHRPAAFSPVATLVSIAVSVVGLGAGTAAAQEIDRRYADEPTAGIALPATPLAGEHDARAVSVNPAGLQYLRGPEALLVLDYQDADYANSSGTGGGLFLAGPLGGTILPPLGFGVGLEVLRPARKNLLPDPGTPLRFTLGGSLLLSRNLALGLSWHHLFDDGGVDGIDAFDFGVSARFGNRAALGAVIRDLNAPRAFGETIQRRYELELTVRPEGSERFELAAGGRVGEVEGELDSWARTSLRLTRGLYAHLALETRALDVQTTSGADIAELDERDLRATLGIEISLGGIGVTTYATGLRDEEGRNRALGATLMVRSSLVEVPSVVAPEPHIERVELSGSLAGFRLVGLVSRLRSIGRDDSARAVALVFDDVSAGWGALREVRDELLALRKRGKKLYAFLMGGDTRDYYLASVADKIFLDPAGELWLSGIATTTLYWRGALELVGITPEFEKIAEYKSAPEQFTRTGPTTPAERMRSELLDGMWNEVVAAIAASRKLPPDEVRRLIDQGPFSAGDLAGNAKLIDAVATPERAALLIAQDLGTLYRVGEPPRERPPTWQRKKIAIIHIQGDIIDGQSQTVPLLGRRMAGGETIAGAIAVARAASEVGAIILRIDSPGGSALASELIAREVFATRGVKPILCSFSNVAASGGYFAAAGCELIFAEPTTVTGSIGIFSGKFDLSGLMNRLGVSADVSTRGKHADLSSMIRPYTEEERQLIRGKLRYTYGRFVSAVAEGRGLTREQVDEIGRGRVWTGLRAQEVGLVDKLGGVGDAIEEARKRMKLPEDERIELVQLPAVEQGLISQLRRFVGAEATAPGLPATAIQGLIEGLMPSLLLAPGKAQARLPFDVTWE